MSKTPITKVADRRLKDNQTAIPPHTKSPAAPPTMPPPPKKGDKKQ